jgi:hypothetical protein
VHRAIADERATFGVVENISLPHHVAADEPRLDSGDARDIFLAILDTDGFIASDS